MKEKMNDIMQIFEAMENGISLEDKCKEMGYDYKKVESIFYIINRLERKQQCLDEDAIPCLDDVAFKDSVFRQKIINRCQNIMLYEIGTDSWNLDCHNVKVNRMSSRTINALCRQSCITLYDLLGLSKYQLKQVRNLGTNGLKEIEEVVNNIASKMFGMTVKDLADLVCFIPNGVEFEVVKWACMNISIHEMDLSTAVQNGIARDMNMRNISHGITTLYDLAHPKSSLSKIKISRVGEENMHVARKSINKFVTRRFGMSMKDLTDMLYLKKEGV